MEADDGLRGFSLWVTAARLHLEVLLLRWRCCFATLTAGRSCGAYMPPPCHRGPGWHHERSLGVDTSWCTRTAPGPPCEGTLGMPSSFFPVGLLHLPCTGTFNVRPSRRTSSRAQHRGGSQQNHFVYLPTGCLTPSRADGPHSWCRTPTGGIVGLPPCPQPPLGDGLDDEQPTWTPPCPPQPGPPMRV